MYNLEDHANELIASHYWLEHYHEGQWSVKYSLLSRSPYSPGMGESWDRLCEDDPEIADAYAMLESMNDWEAEALVAKWFDECKEGCDDETL